MVPGAYERQARLQPGLLLLLPLAITSTLLGFSKNPFVSAALGLIISAGGPFVLMTLVANTGRRLEARLYEQWGGAPSTQLLRLGGNAESEWQRIIWRDGLQKVTGVQLASREGERKDHARADQIIKSAFDQVRYIGQDRKNYEVASAANAQFGFERNLYAVRNPARSLCVMCIIAVAACVAVGITDTAFGLAIVAANLLLLLAWIVIPSERRTREAGFRYASQVLNVVARKAGAGADA